MVAAHCASILSTQMEPVSDLSVKFRHFLAAMMELLLSRAFQLSGAVATLLMPNLMIVQADVTVQSASQTEAATSTTVNISSTSLQAASPATVVPDVDTLKTDATPACEQRSSNDNGAASCSATANVREVVLCEEQSVDVATGLQLTLPQVKLDALPFALVTNGVWT